MTDAPAPADEPDTGPPLVRTADDRVWLGVCAAVGRSTRTDPVLWRVVVAVLVLAGGTGLLLYLAGWALIRDESRDEAPVDRLLRGRSERLTPAALVAVVLVVLVAVAVLDGFGWSGGPGSSIVPVAVVALLIYVSLSRRDHRSSSQQEPAVATALAPEPAPRPPITLLTTSIALLVAVVLIGLAASGVDGITAPRVSAAVAGVLALGLVVGSFFGRQLGLLALTLAALAALGVTAKLDIPFHPSVGERTWVVSESQTYRLGLGEAVLDLREVEATEDIDVVVRVGVGELTILLPTSARVQLHTEVGLGELDLPGQDRDDDGANLEADEGYGLVGGPVITVESRLGIGELTVSRG